MKINLKRATNSDSETIYSWRNDKTTRNMSLDTEYVSWATHKEWYKRIINRDDTILMLCHEEDNNTQSIGMIRLDLESSKKTGSVSINLNPKFRGRSLAKHCLISFINYLKEFHPKLKKITATIKEENFPSIKAFENAGFSISGSPKDGILEYLLHLS